MKTKLFLSTLLFPTLRSGSSLRSTFVFCLLSFVFFNLSSQTPQGFNYQAIARDNSGNPVVGETIDVKLGIQADTSASPVILWEEIHTGVKTNAFGLFTVILGQGTKTDGSAPTFNDVNWSVIPLYLKTQINYKSVWKYMGSSKLWSVPYALVANDLGGPVNKLSVTGNTTIMDEALFEVKNRNGQTVFAVYNEGVRVYVDDGAKGLKGGFAIGGFGTGKGTSDPLFVVSADSIRGYIKQNPAKGLKGGFAIGSFDPTKAYNYEEYLQVTRDSSRIYVKEAAKGLKGGFAIGSFNPAKGAFAPTPFTSLTPDNYFIGERSGIKNTSGIHNSFVGYETGINNTSGGKNVFLGYHAGYSNDTASFNVFIGNDAGYSNNFGRYNAFYGYQSGYKNSSGISNLFLGYQGGYSNQTGNYNSFLGYKAGYANTTGDKNSFLGSFSGISNVNGNNNTYVGYNSGYTNTSGNANNFIGTSSGYNNTSGSNNVFIGPEAGYNNSTGGFNISIGYQSGYTNSIGNYNVSLGYKAGYASTASYNTMIGYQAGSATTSGQFNAFMGYYAGYSNKSGSSNVFIGDAAGYYNLTGNENVAIGDRAGYKLNNNYSNVYVGFYAGYSDSLGYWNTFIGDHAGFSSKSGWSNVLIGSSAGKNMLYAINNVYIGDRCGYNNQVGQNNVAIGYMAGYSSGYGFNYSVFIGDHAGYSSTGESNTFIGYQSGKGNTTGMYNLCFGTYAGLNNSTGSNNVFIGYNAGAATTTTSNNIFIGTNAGYDEPGSNKLYIENKGSADPLIYGDFSARILNFNGKVGINTYNPQAQLQVFNPSTNTAIYVGGSATGQTYLNIGNSSNSNGYCYLQSVKASGTSYGDLILNSFGGNIGIGTTTPTNKLEIGGTDSKIYLNSINSNMLLYNTAGTTAPSYSTRSTGTKIVLYPSLTSSSVDCAIGVNNLSNWYSIPTASFSYSHKFYAGISEIFTIRGDGYIGVGVSNPAYRISVTGGAYCTGATWVNGSDKNLKENFETIDGMKVLGLIELLPLTKWNYKTDDPGVKHIGPVAQDFYSLFGLGNDDKSISSVDPSGIALVAIKELTRQNKTLKEQIESYKSENYVIKSQLQTLQEKVEQIEALLAKGGVK